MSFMGVGSFLSKFISGNLIERFIQVELWLGVVGGVSAAALYLSFSLTEFYYVVAFGFIAGISCLVGIELPLVARMLRDYQSFKDAVAHIFTADYIGALVASILFPLVLLPYLGIVKTAAAMGIVNLLVALVCANEFKFSLPRLNLHRGLALSGICALLLLFASSSGVTSFFERFLYEDEIIYSEQTSYQKIVVTKFKNDIRLFLNGDLQFSSVDEYRYHESLVHVPMSIAANHESVLVLGGGDGHAVREILKYSDVRKITVVDIDPAITKLGASNPIFLELNKSAFKSPKVEIKNEDAWKFIEGSAETFSTIIIDLPDPNDFSLGRLYSKEFYLLLRKRLAPDGVLVTQSTSPYLSREPFWIINQTLKEVFSSVVPYSAYIPSFGQWGFNLAANRVLDVATARVSVPTRYLTPEVLRTLFVFDSDTSPLPVETNHLDNQRLVQAYDRSWEEWN